MLTADVLHDLAVFNFQLQHIGEFVRHKAKIRTVSVSFPLETTDCETELSLRDSRIQVA